MLFAYRNLMQSEEADRIGLGDLDDARLTRSIAIVGEGYQLTALPTAEQVFSRAFLPPLEARRLVVVGE